MDRRGGGLRGPPSEIKEGVIFDPMLLYSICSLVFLGVTCKKSARNLKIWANFQDFKDLGNADFAPPWQTKIGVTRLILKIQDSNFACKPNFHSRTNHILTSMSKDHFFTDLNMTSFRFALRANLSYPSFTAKYHHLKGGFCVQKKSDIRVDSVSGKKQSIIYRLWKVQYLILW